MRSPRRYRRARLWYRWMDSRKERTHNDFDYTRRILKSNSKVKQFLPQFVQTMSDRWPLKEDWRISKKICRKYLKNPLQLHPAERLDDYLPQMEWRFCYYFDGFNSLSHDNWQYDLLALSLSVGDGKWRKTIFLSRQGKSLTSAVAFFALILISDPLLRIRLLLEAPDAAWDGARRMSAKTQHDRIHLLGENSAHTLCSYAREKYKTGG